MSYPTQFPSESGAILAVMLTEIRHDLALLHQILIQGKLPRNLSWNDTVELIGQLGAVEAHGSDDFVFIVGTQRAFFKHPHTHELDVAEVARLRRFLRDAGTTDHPEAHSQPFRMIVVIDHHAAHVYQDQGESRPSTETTTHPYDPFGFHHHLIHRKEAHYSGDRVPEDVSFYEEVAKELHAANEIVLIGHGTGKSSAVDHLVEYLKVHHPDVLKHVLAIETADLSALTGPQIEEIARRHMIAVV